MVRAHVGPQIIEALQRCKAFFVENFGSKENNFLVK